MQVQNQNTSWFERYAYWIRIISHIEIETEECSNFCSNVPDHHLKSNMCLQAVA